MLRPTSAVQYEGVLGYGITMGDAVSMKTRSRRRGMRKRENIKRETKSNA